MAAAPPATPGEAVEDMPVGRVHMLLIISNGLLFMGSGATNEALTWVFSDVHASVGVSMSSMGILFSMQMAGSFASTFLLTFVESAGGRKPLLCGFLCVGMLGVFLQSAATSVDHLFLGRFITGVGVGASYPVGMAHLAEFLPKRNRGKFLSIPHVGYSVGVVMSMILTSIVVNWRLSVSLMVLPHATYLLLSVLFIPESPRYLSVRGRQAEAWAVVRWMHEANGHGVPDWLRKADEDAREEARKDLDDVQDTHEHTQAIGLTSYSFAELRKQDILRKCAAISSVWICLAFASQLMHAWMPFYLSKVEQGNQPVVDTEAVQMPMWNIALFQVLDGTGIIAGAFAQDTMGYRWPLRLGMLAACLCSIASLCPSLVMVTVFGALQQGSQAFCWGIIGSLATLVFPTVIRQSAHSLLRTVENVGMTVGPQVGGLFVGGAYGLEGAVGFGAFVYFLGFLSTWLLHESDDPAHDSLEDSLGEHHHGMEAGPAKYGAVDTASQRCGAAGSSKTASMTPDGSTYATGRW